MSNDKIGSIEDFDKTPVDEKKTFVSRNYYRIVVEQVPGEIELEKILSGYYVKEYIKFPKDQDY